MRCLHQVQLTTFKPSLKSKDFVFALAKTLKPTTTIANQTREERESGLERERERERESKIKTKRGIGSLNKERR